MQQSPFGAGMDDLVGCDNGYVDIGGNNGDAMNAVSKGGGILSQLAGVGVGTGLRRRIVGMLTIWMVVVVGLWCQFSQLGQWFW